ncbi:hypothetical protein MMC20_002620 [Loxospora ochrophaea]|nr:hypothetical protein [Loxospora ochrophaea]
MVLRIPTWLSPRLSLVSNLHHEVISCPFESTTRPFLRPFSSTPVASITLRKLKARELREKARRPDPWAQKQAKARKAKNLSRREELRQIRAEQLGSPIHGIPTPFVKSFDTALPDPVDPDLPATVSHDTSSDDPSSPPPSPANGLQDEHLANFVSRDELEQALEYSRMLAKPMRSDNTYTEDPAHFAQKTQMHTYHDEVARHAVSRILSLSNASSKQRTLVNIQRCIDTFGRHNTDQVLRPRPTLLEPPPPPPPASGSAAPVAPPHLNKTPRAGPDTGSSEVQIAILTAKIRNLAREYEGLGRRDKVNKRNLRLLLHRRQKLLKYLRRKERGSERWTNLVQTLGLTDATWKGQIAVE